MTFLITNSGRVCSTLLAYRIEPNPTSPICDNNYILNHGYYKIYQSFKQVRLFFFFFLLKEQDRLRHGEVDTVHARIVPEPS